MTGPQKVQRIVVTGGTGFVGRAVVRALARREVRLTLLRRPGPERYRSREGNRILAEVAASGGRLVDGDVQDLGALSEAMADAQVVVHLVGIIREFPSRGITFDRVVTAGTRNVVAAACKAGIRRFVLMSALGAQPGDLLPYLRTKAEAERAVLDAAFPETVVFRPSVIYGPGDGFVGMLARMLRRFPVFPIFGDGAFWLQPVPVWVVGEAFAQAAAAPLPREGAALPPRLYEVGGADRIRYDQLLRAVATRVRASVRFVHVPMAMARLVARAGDRLPFVPLTSQQLAMLVRGSVADAAPFYRDFEVPRVRFEEGIRAYEL
ncbi:MAG: NAD(P)H-binding protein [Limnochordaceae bacterium]|nr:NAD(P)H-binding protein [Limnochordaceae bacterium]